VLAVMTDAANVKYPPSTSRLQHRGGRVPPRPLYRAIRSP